jgi:uncharacterized protein with NRDE domain
VHCSQLHFRKNVHRHSNHGPSGLPFDIDKQQRRMCLIVEEIIRDENTKIQQQEYLHRPTAPADWWNPPDQHVLGGRDNHRAEHGTWLGITKQGRLACLTNFKEEDMSFIEGRKSRGAVVNSFLKTAPESQQTTEEVAEDLIKEGLDGIGGFSLLFGRLRNPERKHQRSERSGLAIVSNRSTHIHDIAWLCQDVGETHALSNSHYGDRSWTKVVHAEQLVEDGIKDSYASKDTQKLLISRLFEILSVDTLPRRKTGEEWDVYLNQLRNSIFVPAIGNDKLEERKDVDDVRAANGTPNGTAVIDPTSGVYGTQKQSVILVNRDGKVTFVERTLFDDAGSAVPLEKRERRYDFDIEGW